MSSEKKNHTYLSNTHFLSSLPESYGNSIGDEVPSEGPRNEYKGFHNSTSERLFQIYDAYPTQTTIVRPENTSTTIIHPTSEDVKTTSKLPSNTPSPAPVRSFIVPRSDNLPQTPHPNSSASLRGGIIAANMLALSSIHSLLLHRQKS